MCDRVLALPNMEILNNDTRGQNNLEFTPRQQPILSNDGAETTKRTGSPDTREAEANGPTETQEGLADKTGSAVTNDTVGTSGDLSLYHLKKARLTISAYYSTRACASAGATEK